MNGATYVIASRKTGAYGRLVSMTHILRFLTMLALLIAPLSMIGAPPAQAMVGHAMMASASVHEMAGQAMVKHDSMNTMSHCKGMGKQTKDAPCRSDCQMACAAVPAIPAMSGQLEPQMLVHGLLQQPALVSAPHSLVPEAATPPPRGLLTI